MKNDMHTTLSTYGELSIMCRNVLTTKCDLGADKYHSWCRADPETEKLRKTAEEALETYYKALLNRRTCMEDTMYKEADKCYRIINWDNLFKKLGLR